MNARAMEITLISASDLKNRSMFSKTKAYAVAWISNNHKTRQRTPVDKNGGTDPTWNHVMKFSLNEAALQQGRLFLEIAIYTEATFGDKEIGRVCIPLKEFIKSTSTQLVKYQVRKPSGKAKGILNLSVKLTQKAEAKQQPQAVAGSYGAAKAEPVTAYPAGLYGATKQEPVTAYPAWSYGTSNVEPVTAYPIYPPAGAEYPPPQAVYPPPNSQYPPPQAVYPPPNSQYPPPQAVYPPPNSQYPPPPYPSQAAYPPPPPYYQGYPPNQGYPPYQGYQPVVPVVQQVPRKNNKLGMGLGTSLIGGALGGLLLGDIISDASYNGGFGDGGDF